MDKFSVYSINQHCVDRIPGSGKLKFNIDLSRFEQNEKGLADYFYARAEETYDNDLAVIRNSIKALYADNKDKKILPADIWYYFNDVLNGTVIDTTASQKGNYINRLKNKVILITDGYVEAGKYEEEKTMFSKQDPNKTKFLSSNSLATFRKKFNASSEPSFEKFYRDNGHGLVTIDNPLLAEIDLLVLEFHDRTIENGVTTVSPPDHRIMKLFWRDWMVASGIKEDKLTIYDVFKNEREMDLVIDQFLNR